MIFNHLFRDSKGKRILLANILVSQKGLCNLGNLQTSLLKLHGKILTLLTVVDVISPLISPLLLVLVSATQALFINL